MHLLLLVRYLVLKAAKHHKPDEKLQLFLASGSESHRFADTAYLLLH